LRTLMAAEAKKVEVATTPAPLPAKLSFEDAVKAVSSLKKKPEQHVLLLLYGLFKQANLGDVTGSQPWVVQVEARAKWDAWNTNKGKSKDHAKDEYIQLAAKLISEDK